MCDWVEKKIMYWGGKKKEKSQWTQTQASVGRGLRLPSTSVASVWSLIPPVLESMALVHWMQGSPQLHCLSFLLWCHHLGTSSKQGLRKRVPLATY